MWVIIREYILKYLFFCVKLTLIIISSIITVLFAIVLSPFLPQKIWAFIIKFCATAMLRSMGISAGEVVDPIGCYIQSNTIIVANHISWTDILVLYTVRWVSFVARAEIKKWMLLSPLIKSVGTIFIDRSKRSELVNVNKVLSDKLKCGATIGIFPEGKTSDGNQVMPFKPALIEAAISANSMIEPVAIIYYKKDGSLATEVSYAGETTFGQTLFRALLINGIYVKIVILPKIKTSDFESRDEISQYLFTQINDVYVAARGNAIQMQTKGIYSTARND